ncbi:MAG: TetR family transcriptional regulator [Pseudomonadota bacterium]
MKQPSPSGQIAAGNLSQKKVLVVALGLVQENGIDFSMRALSTRLNVSHMAVYRHFKNRRELLDAIVEAVMEEAMSQAAVNGLSDQSKPWQERLKDFSLAIYDVYVKYPGVAEKVLYGALHTRSGLLMVETAAEFLVKLGLARIRAAGVFQSIGLLVCQVAILDHARQTGESDRDGLLARAADFKDDFPIAHEYIHLMANVSFRDRLKVGLDLFCSAIEAEVSA